MVAFRLSGPHFAIGTWVFAEVYRLNFAQISALGGGSGISLPTDIVRGMADGRAARKSLIYWIALAIILAVIFGIWVLMRWRVSLGLSAIRDNEEAATSVGVGTVRRKFGMFVGVAAMTGMIGALIFFAKAAHHA